jgi:hypothetical protein
MTLICTIILFQTVFKGKKMFQHESQVLLKSIKIDVAASLLA